MAKKIFDFIESHHGLWTAIFTGFLVFFSYKLYQVSDATNKTARATERAFMNFANLGLGARMSSNGQWSGQEIAVNWINAGSTPAHDVVIKGNAKPEFEDLPQTYDFPLLASSKTQAVVGPKGTYGINVFIGRNILADAWHGKSRIFLWGTVIYKDVFPDDPDRLSEFCVEMTHITVGKPNGSSTGDKPASALDIDDPNVEIAAFQWQTCSSGAHNCYDEDCKDYADRIKDMRQ